MSTLEQMAIHQPAHEGPAEIEIRTITCTGCGKDFEWYAEPELYDASKDEHHLCYGSDKCVP